MCNGNDYLTATPSPEAPGAGAVAHMSLHLNQQCQRATNPTAKATKSGGHPSFPGSYFGGLASGHVGDQAEEAVESSLPVR